MNKRIKKEPVPAPDFTAFTQKGELPTEDASSDKERADEHEQGAQLAEAFCGSTPGERRRLARIVDLLPCYVVLIGPDHQIYFHNKTFVDFFGPVHGQPCHMLLKGQEKPCALCAPLDAVAGGNSCVVEWVHHKSNHAFRVYTYPFTEADGRQLALKVGFNITSNVRVQQALDLSEQSYRVITDNLSIGIALLSPDLRVKAGNSRLVQWFGNRMNQEEQICDVLRCPFYSESLSRTGNFCESCPFQAATLENVTKESEFPVTFQDGKERMVRVVACPVAPRRGNVRAIIMMLEDITSRLRITQQLQRAKKLEAMGTLAGGIAHEINQPLSALHLYASGLQMLLEKPGDVPLDVTKERLGLIMFEADRIRGIIAHMRALVMREGKVPLEPVSVAAAVEGVLGIMRSQLRDRGISLAIDVPEDLPLVHSNAMQLEQVLVNLLTNAIHALDGTSDNNNEGMGKNVAASTSAPKDAGNKDTVSKVSRPRKILIRARKKADEEKVIFEVADSGAGLPDGSERIFDPFFSNREQRKGMGLGLSIVHGFVTLWGGQVYAVPRHKELGGAGFFMEIPIAPSTVDDPEEE